MVQRWVRAVVPQPVGGELTQQLRKDCVDCVAVAKAAGRVAVRKIPWMPENVELRWWDSRPASLGRHLQKVVHLEEGSCAWWASPAHEPRPQEVAALPGGDLVQRTKDPGLCRASLGSLVCRSSMKVVTSIIRPVPEARPSHQQKLHATTEEHDCLPAQKHFVCRDLKPDRIPVKEWSGTQGPPSLRRRTLE